MLLKITELLSKKKKKAKHYSQHHSFWLWKLRKYSNNYCSNVLAFIMSGLNTCMFVSRK